MKIIITLLTLFLAENCNQTAKQTNLLNEVESVYFQSWVGGREETGGGTNLFIQFKTSLPKGITFKKAYFQNLSTVIENRKNNLYVAYFKFSKTDLNLDGDSKKEYGNIPPEISKYTKQLEADQAIIEYELNGKSDILIIKNIKEKASLEYPSAKPQE